MSKLTTVQVLVNALKKSELDLPENAGKNELIEKAIERVDLLGEKCKLALEILAADETNKEARQLCKWTLVLAVATVALAVATCAIVFFESQATKHEKVARETEVELLRAQLSDLNKEWSELSRHKAEYLKQQQDYNQAHCKKK